MSLVEWGGLGVIVGDPLRSPWWWPRIVQIWTRLKGIREAAALDPDKLPAPKDLWLDDKALERWYEDREELRKHRSEVLN